MSEKTSACLVHTQTALLPEDSHPSNIVIFGVSLLGENFRSSSIRNLAEPRIALPSPPKPAQTTPLLLVANAQSCSHCPSNKNALEKTRTHRASSWETVHVIAHKGQLRQYSERFLTCPKDLHVIKAGLLELVDWSRIEPLDTAAKSNSPRGHS